MTLGPMGFRATRRGFALLLLGAAAACGHAPSEPASAAPPPAPRAESPPSPPDPRLSFEVRAPYPATLLYALDGAADLPRHHPAYREWLLGGPSEMAPWLETYGEARHRGAEQVDDGDGAYAPFTRCSYDASRLEDLLECLARHTDPADFAIVRRALEKSDELLRERWPAHAAALDAWGEKLAGHVTSPAGQELVALLVDAADLPDDPPLVFHVVLVAKPPGKGTFAHHEGRYFVLEVPTDRHPLGKVDVLFHELAHLAQSHAPGRSALERAFVGRGHAGVIAANLWWESFATAFGNGIAAARLDPTFCHSASMYTDPAVDALGRDLYLRWRLEGGVRIDATLADRLLQAVDTAWPPDRWRVQDLLRRVVVFAQSADVVRGFTRSLHPWYEQTHHPIPPDLERPAEAYPTLPRVVLADGTTLRDRPDLPRAFGLEPEAVEARLASSGASVYWSDDEDGIPLLLVAARSERELQRAARAFAEWTPISERGWTELVLDDPRPMAETEP